VTEGILTFEAHVQEIAQKMQSGDAVDGGDSATPPSYSQREPICAVRAQLR